MNLRVQHRLWGYTFQQSQLLVNSGAESLDTLENLGDPIVATPLNSTEKTSGHIRKVLEDLFFSSTIAIV
jgi:hypothetical protein